MNNNKLPLPQIVIERYLLNELPPGETERIRNQIQNNPQLQEYIQTLKKSNESILAQYPSHLFSKQMQYSLAIGDKKKEKFTFKRTVAVLCTLILAVVIIPYVLNFHLQKASDQERIKGTGGVISIYHKTNSGFEKLNRNDEVSKGDVVQIGYKSMGMPYGVIVSIDGRGSVTLHYPQTKDGSTSLITDTEHFLETSYELDDAPEFERFFFITSVNPLKVDEIIKSAEKIAKTDSAVSANLTLSKIDKQASITLKKRVSL